MIGQCGLDWLEVLAVEMIRWICDAYGRPARLGWERAMARADAVLGTHDGPRFFAGAAAVMSAVRRGRQSGFDYSSPYCAHCCRRLLPLEHDLVRVIRAGRFADPSGIDAHALLLLEGRDTTDLRAAALRLGSVINEVDAHVEAVNQSWRCPEPRPLPPGAGLGCCRRDGGPETTSD
jgi:hypothetical protein